jgi:hypothetical protein
LEDEKLRSLVIVDAITSWKKISEIINSSEEEVKMRWKE